MGGYRFTNTMNITLENEGYVDIGRAKGQTSQDTEARTVAIGRELEYLQSSLLTALPT